MGDGVHAKNKEIDHKHHKHTKHCKENSATKQLCLARSVLDLMTCAFAVAVS